MRRLDSSNTSMSESLPVPVCVRLNALEPSPGSGVPGPHASMASTISPAGSRQAATSGPPKPQPASMVMV